ncbi:MAG: hypothetical protein ABSH00_09980 [Bryobacteraceae bacterium]|jgi:hypothetical protein
MKRSRLIAFGGFFLAALLSSPAWGSLPPQPGTINYIEGRAAIGAHALTEKSVGSVELAAGQSLSTENGRAELLLVPGIFLRVDNHSTVQMVSPGLADTIVNLQKGRAMVEVDEIRPENNVRVVEHGSSTQLLKAGLYDFDADHGLVRVFDGEALVQAPGQSAELKRGRQANLNTPGKMKPRKFDEKAQMDDFYRWASLRSSYLAEANVDEARTYAGGYGWAPGWYGAGWYWDPWFTAYTFIPGDGIFFGPFGWGFYSPWYAFGAPYFGFGYGYGGYYHRFGPGYHPPSTAAARSSAFVGHAYSVRGASAFSRGGAFGGRAAGGGGMRGAFGGRAAGGGGMRGAFGGGFHGGGGGGRR